MSYLNKYNIPEYVSPYGGLKTPDGGQFYFGDYSDAGGFNFPKKKVIPHRHQYFEIFWFPQSHGAFLSDFRQFQLSGPQMVFVSPGQVHGWPGGYGLMGYMLAFDNAFLSEIDGDLLRSPLFYDPDARPTVIIENAEQMTQKWIELGLEFKQQSQDQIAAVQSRLRLILIDALRTAESSDSHPQHSQRASVRIYQQFVKLLSNNIPEKHLPKHYAQKLGVSPDYLSECCRDYSGHSSGELIRHRITLESKRLLAYSDMTISEIAFHLFFKDPSYFSRFFKRNTGILPNEFRKNATSEL